MAASCFTGLYGFAFFGIAFPMFSVGDGSALRADIRGLDNPRYTVCGWMPRCACSADYPVRVAGASPRLPSLGPEGTWRERISDSART